MPLLILDHRILYENSSFQVPYLFLPHCIASPHLHPLRPLWWSTDLMELFEPCKYYHRPTAGRVVNCALTSYWPSVVTFGCCAAISVERMTDLPSTQWSAVLLCISLPYFRLRRKWFFSHLDQKILTLAGAQNELSPISCSASLQVWRNCEEKPCRISCWRSDPELGENRTG